MLAFLITPFIAKFNSKKKKNYSYFLVNEFLLTFINGIFWLVEFYVISTLVGYLMPNFVYIFIY